MKSVTLIAFGLVVLATLAATNPIQVEEHEASVDADPPIEGEDGKLN